VSQTSTVGSINVTDLLEALGVLGADTAALLASAGLTPKALRDPDTRVPTSRVLALLEQAERQLHDPVVGLHAGERVHTRGPLFYLLLSSPRFKEGLDCLKRFARVTLDTAEVTIGVDDDVVSMTVDPGDPAFEESHHAVDFMMGAILGSIRRAVPGFQRLGVDLVHKRVGEQEEAERAFGCPVRFGCRRNVLRFPVSMLTRVTATANPAIAEQVRNYTAALHARVTSGKLQDRVAAAIRALLDDSGRIDRFIVARRLNMSERTLRRRLREEGTTLRIVRDQVRAETSMALLSNLSLKVEAVAKCIGFTEAASFSRAFSRWSGCSPARYRAQLGPNRKKRRG
jgi:AraC-like DNA-binding protein